MSSQWVTLKHDGADGMRNSFEGVRIASDGTSGM